MVGEDQTTYQLFRLTRSPVLLCSLILTSQSTETSAGTNQPLLVFIQLKPLIPSAHLAPCLAPTPPPPLASGIITPPLVATPTVRVCHAACARHAAGAGDGRHKDFLALTFPLYKVCFLC